MNEAALFFASHPDALPLYEAFERRVMAKTNGTQITVHKTQITFLNRRGFAFVSFLPARRAKDRPKVFITVSFGLARRVISPRIDAVSEPYPQRFTHHVVIGSTEEIDDELMGWVREASDFAARPGR